MLKCFIFVLNCVYAWAPKKAQQVKASAVKRDNPVQSYSPQGGRRELTPKHLHKHTVACMRTVSE